MWARNLLFLGVLLGGGLLLRASLFPLHTPARAVHFDSGATADADFASVVTQVNDSFRSEWTKENLTPAPRAADLAISRRLSLALTGTVPSLEEIRQFEAQPPEKRIAGWTTHLLHDRRFADYFADRLGRVFVGTEEGELLVYRKRRFHAWLSDELLKNVSYGEIVRQMIASTGINTDQPAVNFIAATHEKALDGPNPERLAIRFTRAFLGLRLDCAQCHDHFLEPQWKQTDFQGLAAFFGQTRHKATVISDGDGEYRYENRKTGKREVIAPAVPDLPDLPKIFPAEGTRRQRLAQWVTHPKNFYFARATVNRIWALMFNRPLLEGVEAMRLDEKGPKALDILAKDFTAHDYDLRRLIQLIAATEVFHIDSAAAHEITEAHEQSWAVFPLTRLRPEQVIGSVIQAASVQTINQNSHIVTRLVRYANERDFVKRYGDPGDDEFERHGGTIAQRLLMMNGNLVNEKARPELMHASAQVAMMAPSDRAAVEAAYLTVLTRRPTPSELAAFSARLADVKGNDRQQRLADLYWVLFNATESSWNH
jgi:hypothetical protein